MTGTIILIGVVAFLIGTTLAGYFKGLIKTVFSLFSVVIILTLVTVLNPIAKEIVNNTPVETWVYEKVEEFVDDKKPELNSNNPISDLGEKKQTKIINDLPLPESLRQQLIESNNEEGYKALNVDDFYDYIIAFVTEKILDTITFVVLFVVVTILVYLVIFLLDIFAKLPVIKWFNKGGGAALGFLEGVLIIWILCIIVTMFSTTEWGQKLFEEINNNAVLDLIYSNNLLQMFVDSIFKS